MSISRHKVYTVIYKCKKCPYIAKSLYFIENHIKLHQNAEHPMFNCSDNLESFVCTYCNFSTCHLTTFRIHNRNHHIWKTEVVETSSQEHNHLGASQYIQDGFVLNPSNENYDSKLLIPDDLKESLLKNVYGNQLKEVKWFQCDHCSYKSKSKHDLQSHIICKHYDEWFQCIYCSFKTKYKTSLVTHTSRKHIQDGTNWLHSDNCSLMAHHKNTWETHAGSPHPLSEDIKWLQCDHCPFRTKFKRSLQVHLTCKHTPSENIKWFQCDRCAYKSKLKFDLQRHTLCMHTPSENVEWFQCDHCSYKTKCRSNLRQHVLHQHTPYENIRWFSCDHCSYKSKRKGCLVAHALRKHTSGSVK